MLFLASQNAWQIVAIFAVVIGAAAILARRWPAYRAELRVEAATRRLSLDGLRGLLCFGVLIHHAACTLQTLEGGDPWRWAMPASHVYAMLGTTSVSLFFCITAFLFWGRVLRHNSIDWFDFARGRVLRVVPMYAVAALPVLAIATWHFAQIHATPVQVLRNWAQVATVGVLEWQPIGTRDGFIVPSRINAGVHWSLRYEWIFYSLLPLTALLPRRRRPGLLAAAWVAAIAFFTLAGLPTFLTMFPIGMLAAHAARYDAFADSLRRRRYSLVALVALALIAALGCRATGIFSLTADTRSPLGHLLLLVAFVPIACGNDLFGFLSWPSLRLMGTVSYGVYLIHGIVLFLSRGFLAPLTREASDPNPAYWAAVAGLAIVTLLTSCVTYLAVERPFVALEHRLRRERRERNASLIEPTATAPCAT